MQGPGATGSLQCSVHASPLLSAASWRCPRPSFGAECWPATGVSSATRRGPAQLSAASRPHAQGRLGPPGCATPAWPHHADICDGWKSVKQPSQTKGLAVNLEQTLALRKGQARCALPRAVDRNLPPGCRIACLEFLSASTRVCCVCWPALRPRCAKSQPGHSALPAPHHFRRERR